MKLKDISVIETSKKHKYKKGAIAIQIKATDCQTIYLYEDDFLDEGKYAVITETQIDSYILFLALEDNRNFLNSRKQGLNILLSDVENINLTKYKKFFKRSDLNLAKETFLEINKLIDLNENYIDESKKQKTIFQTRCSSEVKNEKNIL